MDCNEGRLTRQITTNKSSGIVVEQPIRRETNLLGINDFLTDCRHNVRNLQA